MDRVQINHHDWVRFIKKVQRIERVPTIKESVPKLGITDSTYYNILNDKNMTINTLIKIEKYTKQKGIEIKFIKDQTDETIKEQVERIEKELNNIKQKI